MDKIEKLVKDNFKIYADTLEADGHWLKAEQLLIAIERELREISNHIEPLVMQAHVSQGVQNGGHDWTKIEDEEPPEMGTYIVFNGRNVTTANWDKYGFYKTSPGGTYKVSVEQWMLLPDAP